MGGWGLSSWLGLVRCIQILASLVASSLQAFLVGYITTHSLGLAQNAVVLQAMMTAVLAFVLLAFTLVHTGGRSKETPWLVAAIGGDVIFIGIDLAAITILAQAGLPSHCAGLTRWNFLPDDANYEPNQGYTSIRFTNQWNGAKGELDRYCALERGFYIIAVALVFAFMMSIILSILRICQGSYTKNTKVDQLVSDAIREEGKARSKPNSLASAGTPRTPPMPVPSQHPSQPPILSHHHRSGSSTSVGPAMCPQVSTPVHNHHQHQQLSPIYSHPPQPSSSSAAHSPMQNSRFGYETPEDEAAAAALITDGSRSDPEAGGSGLPPYTPGRLRPMMGHGDESNEIRLSDYVKGETRAQNMKDGFR